MLGGGVGLATGLVVALFPFAAVGGGLLAGTTAGGAILGAVAGHAAAGMSRHDLKELGEHLDAGQAGLVVVAVSDMGAKVEQAMKRADEGGAEAARGRHGRDRARRGRGRRSRGVGRDRRSAVPGVCARRTAPRSPSSARGPARRWGADAVAAALPRARRLTLAGQTHVADPAVLAPVLAEFLAP